MAGEVPGELRTFPNAEKQRSTQRMMGKCPKDPGTSTKGLLLAKFEIIEHQKCNNGPRL